MKHTRKARKARDRRKVERLLKDITEENNAVIDMRVEQPQLIGIDTFREALERRAKLEAMETTRNIKAQLAELERIAGVLF